MMTKRSVLAVTVLLLVLGVLTPANAYVPPGQTQRVSVATGGDEAGHGGLPAATCCSEISADGQHVAFTSGHDTLVADDANHTLDVFVHHRATGDTERVSVAADGSELLGESYAATISGDGRHVAFETNAASVVPGDENWANDIFVRDLVAGTTQRVSVTPDGGWSTGYASSPDISADGRFVAFQSTGADLVPGDTNALQDVFVHDLRTARTVRVSVGSGGAQVTGGASGDAAISADGRFVAFESTATNLVADDTNAASDVFVHDLLSGTTERVSVSTAGVGANDRALDPAISADGSRVAFHSVAANLVPGDANTATDVFVRDRVARTTQRVSLSAAGEEHPGPSIDPAISGDGRYVAFYVVECALIPGDGCLGAPVGDDNATVDVVVRDLMSGSVERVSAAHDGAEADSWSYDPTMSFDGRWVAFYSFATNIIPDDGNGVADVFVRDRGTAGGVDSLGAQRAGDRITVSGTARFASVPVTSGTDPGNDATTSGGSVGGELTGARLIQRPEDEDLLAVLDVASFPAPSVASGPGVVYGMSFTAGGARYEVRALRVGAAVPLAAPYFGLHRCNPGCTEIARLAGGIGTAASSVTVAIPRTLLGTATTLTEVRAFTAAGDAAVGAVQDFDELGLPPASLGVPAVEVAIAPAASAHESASFATVSGLAGGRVTATIDAGSLPAGDYRVWARVCTAMGCGAARSTPIKLP
jgi:Tol biopolymer transport system component